MGIDAEISRLIANGDQASNGMVSGADGTLLQILIESSGAKRVLEIGTGVGLSSLYLCKGLEKTGGTLVTIEGIGSKLDAARKSFEAAGCAKSVVALQGDALEILAKLEGPLRGPYDLVFSDAAKTNNLHYFDAVMPLLRVGGLLAAHDTLCAENLKMRDYFDMLKAHPSLRTVFLGTESIVRAGDPRSSAGLALSHKLDDKLDNVKRWSWHGRTVVDAKFNEVPARHIPYKVRSVYEDDYGSAAGLVEIAAGTPKEDVIGLCRQALRERTQPFFSIHVYDHTDAFDSRDDFEFPRERYFKHLVAHAYRHPTLDRDEIYYHPEKLVLRLPKTADIDEVSSHNLFGAAPGQPKSELGLYPLLAHNWVP